ncbi:MAG: helix-turn-helix transcriptional regulator [Bacteroidota bacterium]
MRGTQLGEFEELVLLIVANLYQEASGLRIQEAIKERSQRSASISMIHATLQRLKKKGFLTSEYDNSSITERGGRPRLLFRVTQPGHAALLKARDLRNDLWDTIPEFAFRY